MRDKVLCREPGSIAYVTCKKGVFSRRPFKVEGYSFFIMQHLSRFREVGR